jgi:valyl-tRNA synthetase
MLRMLHPFIPYITEELWEQMHLGTGMIHENTWDLSAFKRKLEGLKISEKECSEVGRLVELVGQLRTLKAEHGNGNKSVVTYILSDKNCEDFEKYRELLVHLVGLKALETTQQPLSGLPNIVTHCGTFFIETSSANNAAGVDETQLRQQLEVLSKHIQTAETKLSNEKFLSHAAPNVIEGVRRQLEENRRKYEVLKKLTT